MKLLAIFLLYTGLCNEVAIGFHPPALRKRAPSNQAQDKYHHTLPSRHQSDDGRCRLPRYASPVDDNHKPATNIKNRRDFIQRIAAYLAFSQFPEEGQARGLVSFPCEAPLLNVYHLMRGGISLLEEQDILSTNPLFLTNREAALSDQGVEQVREACRILQAADINPSVIKYSLAASAVDSAMLIRDDLKVGQNRLIPEFTFMDPRAIGRWDMMSAQETYPAIVALDEAEAGADGKGGRPPPNIDGTPHDTLADQAIRLRQLLSILETQFSGDSIVLVFPDGSSPALLSAMMAGVPYNKAHVLDFAPGEIRLDVTMQSTLQLYEEKVQANAKAYTALIQSGQKELSRLRSIDDEDLISKKDQMVEQERLTMEQEYQEKEQARIAKEEVEKRERLQRLREMETLRRAEAGPLEDAAIPSLVVGGTVITAATLLLPRSDKDKQPQIQGVDASTYNTAPATPSTQAMSATQVLPGEGQTKPTTNNITDPSGSSSIEQYRDESSNGYSLYPETSKTEEEKLTEAKEAMQSYLDQDDGGSAWLKTMAELVVEDDDENDEVDDDTDPPSRLDLYR